MKTVLLRTLLACLPLAPALFVAQQAAAQPDYVFRNAVLLSGTDKQIGARYRFANIKTNVDGIMTITDIKNLTLNTLDGASGFDEAFQPSINVPRRTKGHIEFQLDFVNAGTFTPKSMIEVPMTAIDIDGYTYPDEKVYEFDEFEESPSYYIQYDLVGSALNVSFAAGWAKVINRTAIDYPGIDTTQTDVMFSMVYAGVSSVKFRCGADNKSNTNVTRLRSVYFKKFNFPGFGILSQSPVQYFTGAQQGSYVQLQWSVLAGADMKACILERSVDGRSFMAIQNFAVLPSAANHQQYTDALSQGRVQYRLKLSFANGSSQYSQILSIENGGKANRLQVFPTVIQSNATISINSQAAGSAQMNLVSYSGQLVQQQTLRLNKGTNSFAFTRSSHIPAGQYILSLVVAEQQLTTRVIIQ